MTATKQLEDRAATLEREGADPLRVELVKRARRFKRGWIEMAEALIEVRERGAYEAWGYPDLHRYCEEELLLTRRTVDKLIGSYATLKRHAPRVLRDDGPAPQVDAVDYFARVVEQDRAPRAAVEELRQAVFDEGRDVGALRRQFNPLVFAKTEPEAELDTLDRATSAAQHLAALVPKLRGLSRERTAQVMTALEALQADLAKLGDRARAREREVA